MSISQSIYAFTVNTTVATATGQVGGGASAAGCLIPGGPSGLTLGSNCAIQGTPHTVATNGYSVNAPFGAIALKGFTIPQRTDYAAVGQALHLSIKHQKINFILNILEVRCLAIRQLHKFMVL